MEYRVITHTDSIAHQSLPTALIQSVFGIDFTPWLERSLWGDTYQCHVILDKGRVVSNIAVLEMDLWVQGKPVHAAQLGGVATLPPYRSQGLSRQLMTYVLAQYPMPLFLFANDSVLDFYPRFGFRPFALRQPYINITPSSQPGKLQALSVQQTGTINHYLHMPRPMSARMDCINTSVQWFHCLLDYADHLYEIPGKALVICEKQQERLLLYDVCGGIMWEELFEYLPLNGVREIVFGFEPDRLGVTPLYRSQPEEPAFALRWQPGVCTIPETVKT